MTSLRNTGSCIYNTGSNLLRNIVCDIHVMCLLNRLLYDWVLLMEHYGCLFDHHRWFVNHECRSMDDHIRSVDYHVGTMHDDIWTVDDFWSLVEDDVGSVDDRCVSGECMAV